CSTGDGGPATSAFINPWGVAVDASGALYFSDASARVRKIAPGGTISTVAGDGNAGFAGDGSAASAARLNGPRGLALDAAGALYIADTINNRVRRVTLDGVISTV